MKIKHVACAILVNENNEVLIQKREGISKYWEEWSFFGGWIEGAESSREALVREMSEELEKDIGSWKYSDLWEVVHMIPWFDIEYHRHVFLLHIPVWSTDFVDHEWAGAYFFSIEEIREKKFNTPIHEEMERVIKCLEKHWL